MYVLAITNQKGGSGKTTTAVNLAATLAEAGKRVLVIDLDPQASASSWLGSTSPGRGLFEVFTGEGGLADLIQDSTAPGVQLVPASPWMVGVDRALAGEVGAELIFRKSLRALPQDRWDLVLLDCAPSLGLLAVSALAACQAVLVPVEARVMALAGLAALVQTLDRVRERLNPGLEMAGIVPCRVDSRTRLSTDVVASLRERFGDQVFQTAIRENVRLAEAPSFHKPITLYDPKSVGAADYRALARELLDRSFPGGRR